MRPIENWNEGSKGTLASGSTSDFSSWQFWSAQVLEDFGDQSITTPPSNVPFSVIFTPFVDYSWTRVCAQCPQFANRLSEQARDHALDTLYRDLSWVSSYALMERFKTFQLGYQSGFERSLRTSSALTGDSQYLAFAGRFDRRGFEALFNRYPVLARLISTVSMGWCETLVEMGQRLASDERRIASELFDTKKDSLGQITHLQLRLSDRHKGGRQVCRLTFRSHERIIYKPRDMGMEAAWASLVNWLAVMYPNLQLKAASILARNNYGWAEAIGAKECVSWHDARLYFRRAGMLQCLLHVLEAIDIHEENVIASRAHPVVVDLETLFNPRRTLQREPPGGLHELFESSVVGTDFLPQWLKFGTDSDDGISGLGVLTDAREAQAIRVEQPNCDGMDLSRYTDSVPESANFPRLCGRQLSAEEFIDDVVGGFSDFYVWLSNHRAQFCRCPAFESMRNQRVRLLFRATESYDNLLDSLRHPKYLRSAEQRSRAIDTWVSQPHKGTDFTGIEQTEIHRIWREEARQLDSLDIPVFDLAATEKALYVSVNRKSNPCCSRSGSDAVKARIDGLSDTDRHFQMDLIQHAINGAQAIGSQTIVTSRTPEDSSELARAALDIADDIVRRAVRDDCGGLVWMERQFDSSTREVRPIGANFYQGTCGVVLFLATAEHFVSDRGYRESALSALSSVRQRIREFTEGGLPLDFSIGGGDGLGSVLYCLARVADLLSDETVMREAERAAALLTAQHVAADQKFDLLMGSAGAILGLLSVHSAVPNDDWVNLAQFCGDHLVKTQLENGGWPVGGSVLCGMSHGAAGIAYALARLFRVSGRQEYAKAANRAIAFEDRHMDVNVHNWRDLRQGESMSPVFASMWCHGAPGIGLARIAMMGLLGHDRMEKEITLSLSGTIRSTDRSLDHLCCGQFGIIETLLVGSHSQRPELRVLAEQRALEAVRRARRRGGYALDADLAEPQSVGFFRGISGIGYQLLRLEYPERVPSALLWEDRPGVESKFLTRQYRGRHRLPQVNNVLQGHSDTFLKEMDATRSLLKEFVQAGIPPNIVRRRMVEEKLQVLPRWTDSHLRIYRASLLTAIQCQRIIDSAEEVAAQIGWTSRRHKNYPTTDLPISMVPKVRPLIQDTLFAQVLPFISDAYRVVIDAMQVIEVFIVKYHTDGQSSLDLHEDGSMFTFNVMLSASSDFDGGGCYFSCLDNLLFVEQGECIFHAGKLQHAAQPITRGTRYAMVGFIAVDGYPHEKIASID